MAAWLAALLSSLWLWQHVRCDSPLYQVARLAADAGNSSLCRQQLTTLRLAVDAREPWALYLLDSSGTPGTGFLWGNGFWLGSYTQCRAARPQYQVVANHSPPFPVDYLTASATHHMPLQVHVGLPAEDLVTIGLCVPASCQPGHLAELLDQVFLSRSLQFQQLLQLDLKLLQVRNLHEDPSFPSQASFIIAMGVLGLMLALVVVGTLYDTVVWQRQVTKCHCKDDHPVIMHVSSITTVSPVKQDQPPMKEPIKQMKDGPLPQYSLGRFLLCFSAYSNTGIVFSTELGPQSVAAVHGLRFLGMIWIIMVHTVFYISDFVDNKPQAFFMSEGFMVQIISNSVLSVDTFFFLSGFLVSYLYYKGKAGMKKGQPAARLKDKLNEILLMVAHRFARLTPAYMGVLGLTTVNMAYYNRTTPYHMTERADVLCPRYWWRNLLYINNLFSREEMCMSWSWYLSNDMQFFVLGSCLLVLSSAYFSLSVVLMVVLLVTSSAATGLLSYSYGYVPTLDQQLRMLNVLYDPPWTRVGPYLVGMVAGYVVVRSDGRLLLNKCTLLLCWAASCTCNLAILFGLYDRHLPHTSTAVYMALSRPAWGLGLAWLIIACCTGNAGFINTLLSFPAWIPLSRLTYCAYLLNPLIMSSVYASSERPLHIDFLPLSSSCLGHLMMSYLCAYAVSLVFETPAVLLVRRFVERPRSGKASG